MGLTRWVCSFVGYLCIQSVIICDDDDGGGDEYFSNFTTLSRYLVPPSIQSTLSPTRYTLGLCLLLYVIIMVHNSVSGPVQMGNIMRIAADDDDDSIICERGKEKKTQQQPATKKLTKLYGQKTA